MQRRQQLGQRLVGVVHRAAVHAAVQVGRRPLHGDFARPHAAQPVDNCRLLRRQNVRIRNEHRVRRQLLGVAWHVGLDVRAAGFLLALDQQLHVHGQPAFARQQRLHGLDVDKNLPLIVRCAARVDVVPILTGAHVRLEGRRRPQLNGVNGLHVVVAVDKHGRCITGCVEPIGVDKRVLPLGFDQLDVL